MAELQEIIKITDQDFGLEPRAFEHPRQRRGARGIILNDKGEVAILNKANKNEYKLVGGGIEEGEDPETAFKREALEEAGCEVEIDQCLGLAREEKSQDNFIQESYIFLAHVVNDTDELHLTEKEKDEGARLIWLEPAEALAKIKDCEDKLVDSGYENIYHTKFIVRRDYAILDYYLKHQKGV